MSLALDRSLKQAESFLVDRPAWIPDHITGHWDTNPYAYQTEEEQMPAGGPHGRLLSYIIQLISHLIEPKGVMLLLDTFMLYRDKNGIKRRLAPDLLLMPYRDEAPSAYDLETEEPPLMVVEVTSPDSHLSDLEEKNIFYMGLGIPTYLVIDAIKPNSDLRSQIELHLWRSIDGRIQKMEADGDGSLLLPEMGLRIAAAGRKLLFRDAETGEIARDAGQLTDALEHEQKALEIERQERIRAEEKAADLKAEIELLRKELRK